MRLFFTGWGHGSMLRNIFCYKQLFIHVGRHINPFHQFEQINTIICAAVLGFAKHSNDYFYINWINLTKSKIWMEKCSQMFRWLVTGVYVT